MTRERLASALRPAAQALVASLLSCADPALAAGAPPAVTQVESIAMTVSDMDRAVDFYTRVLTFEKVTDREVSGDSRSEEHTSELQSPCNLVCRLLLEKKKM